MAVVFAKPINNHRNFGSCFVNMRDCCSEGHNALLAVWEIESRIEFVEAYEIAGCFDDCVVECDNCLAKTCAASAYRDISVGSIKTHTAEVVAIILGAQEREAVSIHRASSFELEMCELNSVYRKVCSAYMRCLGALLPLEYGEMMQPIAMKRSGKILACGALEASFE